MIIYKPVGGSHSGDTFRELLDMWVEDGYCTTEPSPDNYVWVDEPGSILLYDYPRLDDRPIPQFKFGLFGNTVPDIENCFPWIFWGRRPRMLEDEILSGILSYDERKVESVFLGKIENQTQYNNRTTHDWSSVIENFSMPVVVGNTSFYPYTQEEYLKEIKKSKFGLTLPGYGPKCNREIEYLGLGVVPILIGGCDVTYHNSMEEDIHYIKVEDPLDLKERISAIEKNEWEFLSNNGRMWYNQNCSRKGSFSVTEKILENIKCEIK